jgi:hypothetical protein
MDVVQHKGGYVAQSCEEEKHTVSKRDYSDWTLQLKTTAGENYMPKEIEAMGQTLN